MKVTILELAEDRFRLRVETKDEFGKRRFAYETIRGTRSEAEARRDELKRGANVSTKSSYTFDEYFERWVDDRLAYAEIMDTTALLYRRRVAHFRKLLGHKRLGDLTPTDIENAWRTLLKSMNPPFVRDIAKSVKTVLKGAVDAGLIPANPATAAKTPKNKRELKSTTLSKTQMETLVENSKGWGNIGRAVRFALATGCRRGEICGLQWQDVDFDKGTVSVKRGVRTVKSKLFVGALKTSSSARTISVPVAMLEELRPFKGAPTEWVFPREDGRLYAPEYLSRRVITYFERVGLKDFSMHDLRHAHATYLLQQKMPLKAVSRRLGHADVNVTLGIYAHVMPGDDEQLADAINGIL